MLRGTTLSLLVLVGAMALMARQDDGKVFPFPINQITLDNGLKIVSIPFDSPGIIAYYTVVRTGSRNEIEPGKSGFAHFFEHMMFRGTEKYSAEKFNEMLKAIGADNNANTSDDRTVYHTLASADALETIMDMESDRFMNLKYSEADFRTEAGAILGEYNKNYSSPFMTIFEKMREAAYDKHTYKHTTMGFLKDIEDMPNQYQYSLEFFDRWYRPENCVVVVVGDFNQERLVALAKQYYGPWKRGTYKLDVPAEPPQTQEKTINLPWKAKTLPVVAMGYHGPAFSDNSKDMPAMDLLSQLLFSPTSDLFRKLVVEQQLVEFVQGSQGDSRDPGLFQIFTRVKDPKNIELVRSEIEKAIEDAKVTPIPEERLKAIKSYLRYQYAMGLDNPNSVANSIGHYIMLTGDPESVNRVYRLYEQITPEDIMGVAKKYMTSTNRTTVILKQEESSQ